MPPARARAVALVLAFLSAGWLLNACESRPSGVSSGPSQTSAATAAPTASPAPTATGTFSVSSVTFVSPELGWVLGSRPCSGSSQCLALMRTGDGGQIWSPTTAPPTHLSAAAQPGGVSQVRFANREDGWAFDPELWSTHNGGATWARITLPAVSSGAIVARVEAADGLVQAAVLDPRSSMVRIETSLVATDSWHISPTSIPIGAGPAAMLQLVLQGASGWLIEDDRAVVGGARLINGRWEPWQPPCPNVNGAAFLAASTRNDLIAVCDQGAWGPATPAGPRTYVSSDGGISFRMLSSAGPSGVEDEGCVLASPIPGVAVATGDPGLMATFDGGVTWTTVYAAPTDTFMQYVGFETSTQGVAIASNDAGTSPVGSLLMTLDGGHLWSPVTF